MKSKGLIVIIIILLLGLCGSVGYIVYDKVMVQEGVAQKEEKEKEKEQDKEEVSIKKLTEKDVTTFMYRIDFFNTFFSKKYPIEDVSKLSNQDVLLLGEIYVTRGLFTQGSVTGFTGDVIREGIVTTLGADYPIKMEDINCYMGDGTLYQYNASMDEFHMIGNHGHDGIGGFRNKAYFQDGTYDEETGTYEIHVKVVSSSSCGGTCGPRTDFYNGFNYNETIYNTNEDTEYDVVYKEISDKLSIVTYTFVKNSDGGYGLKSVTM